jgi:mitochondrial fission protein ELM1
VRDTRSQPAVWLLCVRRQSHINQCRALIDHLGLEAEEVVQVKGTNANDGFVRKKLDVLRAIAVCAAQFLKRRPAHDAVIVSSGRSISLLAWLLRRARGDGVFVIYIGDAKSPLRFCDMMIVPRHDMELRAQRSAGSLAHTQFVVIDGILNSETPRLGVGDDRSILVCVGGDNKTYSYAGDKLRSFVSRLAELSTSHKVTVAYSGRTLSQTRQLLKSMLPGPVGYIEANDRPGFLEARASAGHLIVCPDSVSMISEALTAGLRVYVPELDMVNSGTSDALFVADCMANGYILPMPAFPAAKPPRPFPNALAIAGPAAEKAIAAWMQRRGRKGA